ncbi:DUF4082 domain-containing protein [Paractinoplanes maris]|uniref:DUF4082 domain-containing protein n=1 Tax=Paractinoplanes maris TaxID=1734446 RepID=UPI0020209F47|nr:DUF4082 domain-containing protein [Actinoplanes maris]
MTTTDRRRLIAVAAVITLLIVAGVVSVVLANRNAPAAPRTAAAATSAASETFSFFADDDTSEVQTTEEKAPVEIGLRFSSTIDGTLAAVRFLRAHNDSSSHPVTVWSVRGGKKLASADSSATLTGWQEVPLSAPVAIEAGEQYVVSYQADRYRASTGFFSKPAQAGPLSAAGDAGVFAYNEGTLPALSYQASNYWVDVVFRSATAAPSAAAPAEAAAMSLPRIPWEGGPSYYKSFPQARKSGWDKESFFPLAVWYEQVSSRQDVTTDKAMGLNTYIMVTADSNLRLIKDNGMSAMIAEDHQDRGDESVGWVLADEADMWGKAGPGRWTGKWPGQGDTCTPATAGCGFDIQKKLRDRLPDDGRMPYANYGKGVMFWESDEDAARFVNDYSAVVSNDIYWYTDGNVCKAPHEGPVLGVKEGNCRRAANYGLTVDRMRTLDAADGKHQPVFNFVEVGHPIDDSSSPTITGEQVAGAVMSSVIHEARGIVYFNHNFGGPCVSQHVLREKCGDAVRPAVTEVNRRITELAPVLNTQSYQWTFNPAVDTMLKARDGSYYIFAMPGREGGTGEQTLKLPPGIAGSQAEVMFENRTIPITDGNLHDTFSRESSYHIYRVTP